MSCARVEIYSSPPASLDRKHIMGKKHQGLPIVNQTHSLSSPILFILVGTGSSRNSSIVIYFINFLS